MHVLLLLTLLHGWTIEAPDELIETGSGRTVMARFRNDTKQPMLLVEVKTQINHDVPVSETELFWPQLNDRAPASLVRCNVLDPGDSITKLLRIGRDPGATTFDLSVTWASTSEEPEERGYRARPNTMCSRPLYVEPVAALQTSRLARTITVKPSVAIRRLVRDGVHDYGYVPLLGLVYIRDGVAYRRTSAKKDAMLGKATIRAIRMLTSDAECDDVIGSVSVPPTLPCFAKRFGTSGEISVDADDLDDFWTCLKGDNATLEADTGFLVVH